MNLWIASELENVAVVTAGFSLSLPTCCNQVCKLIHTMHENSLNLFILMRELGNMEDAGTPFTGQGPHSYSPTQEEVRTDWLQALQPGIFKETL